MQKFGTLRAELMRDHHLTSSSHNSGRNLDPTNTQFLADDGLFVILTLSSGSIMSYSLISRYIWPRSLSITFLKDVITLFYSIRGSYPPMPYRVQFLRSADFPFCTAPHFTEMMCRTRLGHIYIFKMAVRLMPKIAPPHFILTLTLIYLPHMLAQILPKILQGPHHRVTFLLESGNPTCGSSILA